MHFERLGAQVATPEGATMGLFESIRVQATERLIGATGSEGDAGGGRPLLGAVMEAVRQHGLEDLAQRLSEPCAQPGPEPTER